MTTITYDITPEEYRQLVIYHCVGFGMRREICERDIHIDDVYQFWYDGYSAYDAALEGYCSE